MCDYSGRLVAWLDREIASEEAAEIERHVRECRECQSSMTAYESVSNAFEGYCKAVAESKETRKAIRKEPVLWAAAAAIMMAAALVYPRGGVKPPMAHPAATNTAVAATQPILAKAVPDVSMSGKSDARVHRRRARATAVMQARSQVQTASRMAEESAIQIAIPAEAMFPPGALPEGVDFFADLSIGADGTVEQVRLLPRATRFERRPDQP